MFANSKLHYYSITAAIAAAVGLLAVFVATGFIFTSDSPVSKSAMLVGGIFLLIGAIEPRRILVLLVPITFYLDGVKRLLILTGRTELNDVTSILAVAPLATVGIIVGCVIRRIFRRKPSSPIERLAIFAALGAFVAFGGTGIFTAGNILYGLKTAANTTVYFLLPWAVIQCFTTQKEIERFLKFAVIVGIPVALYGSWQYVMGLSQFEIDYLKSGLSTVGEINLDDVRPRPFSTLSSTHSYSCVMMFMLALSIYFSSSLKVNWANWKGRVVIAIYVVALALSTARSTMAATVAMLIFAKLFCTRRGVMFAYSVSVVLMGGMILFAVPILNSLDEIQSYLPMGSDWQQQAFRLGTWSDRLMGYRNVLGNPGSWPLIANPLKVDFSVFQHADAEYTHDLFSQMILRIGAIPVLFGACLAVFILWRAHRAILQLPRDKEGIRTLAARLMAIIVVFLLSQLAGSGITVFPMNFWMGIFAGLLSVICLHARKIKPLAAKTGDMAVAAPAMAGAK